MKSIYSSFFSAETFNDLLHLVQPPQQLQQQQQLLTPPSLVVSAVSDQHQHPSQTDATPDSLSGSPASPQCPSLGPSAGLQDEGPVVGAQGPEQTVEHPDNESLSSLLNEIVYLNQQTVTARPQEEEQTDVCGLLQLDPDSDDTVTLDLGKAGLNDLVQMTLSGELPGPADANTTCGALAPPPLLQMKAGMSKVVDPSSRPMPRLVPLGLRGNPTQLTADATAERIS